MKNIDNFKTYEGYEGLYIVEDYIRSIYIDTVIYSSNDEADAMDYMDNNDLWEHCTLFYIDNDGNANYPEFF